MEFFESLDKINIPVFVCSKEWTVVYRNRVCKKYTTSPRVNSKFSKCFFNNVDIPFPVENGGISLVVCTIRDTYKTAVCFEYKGYALMLFPTVFDFDILFSDVYKSDSKDVADAFRNIFGMFDDFSDIKEDKYRLLEKVRNYAYSAIDNYVALSMFDTDKRVSGSFMQIYKFFCDNVVKTANKAGYKVVFDLSKISELGSIIYTDTTYFSMVLSGLLIFCLSVSSDKKCLIEAEYFGGSVRNKIRFTYNRDIWNKTDIDLMDFIRMNPTEYINFIPFEELCRSLGWDLKCDISADEELNASIWFDVSDDSKIKFRSAGKSKIVTPEEIIFTVIANAFSVSLK